MPQNTDARHFGAKTKFNVKLPFKVTRGHVFRGHGKANDGLHITV